MWLAVALVALVCVCDAFTPYEPTVGWTYYLEAAHPPDGPATAWPKCPFRFLSFPETCDAVNLWRGAGVNQRWELVPADDEPGAFFVQAGCGQRLGYSASCGDRQLSLGVGSSNEHTFRFTSKAPTADSFEWSLEAAARHTSCSSRWLSFPASSCDATSPVPVTLADADASLTRFRVHPIAGPPSRIHATNTDQACADPFAWPTAPNKYSLVCTGGLMTYFTLSGRLSANATFVAQGGALPTSQPQPTWARSGNRWAPETTTVPTDPAHQSLLFFSDSQPSGPRRVGWAWATGGAGVGEWNRTAPTYMDLGQSKAGEIDQHIFRDSNGSTYICWKTDDNSLQEKLTRIWIQEIVIDARTKTVRQIGTPLQILDSSGLFWADSFVPGGALVEGPEIVQHDEYYYLFFAAGKFCQDSYSEGVARSRSVFGPYTKLGVPLLSTGMVGYAITPPNAGEGQEHASVTKLVGPGHGSFVQDPTTKDWFVVYHASRGENCDRYTFVDGLVFGSDGWPRVNFVN